jgi:hypothetical protein
MLLVGRRTKDESEVTNLSLQKLTAMDGRWKRKMHTMERENLRIKYVGHQLD